MKIAVVGGTGLTGREVVRAVEAQGHQPVVIARSRGVDIVTGEGLDAALTGVDAIIDVSNGPAENAEQAREFFGTATRTLVTAGARAGVGHHVVLSIVGIDRVAGNPHYAGKRHQEEVALSGPIPTTVVRATQFHDFAAMVVGWSATDGVAPIAPLLVQPIAVPDLADVLVEVAGQAPTGGIVEVAGPRTEDLVDMARRTLAVRGQAIELEPTWRGRFSPEMAGEVLLPGPAAKITPTTFEQWLATDPANRPGAA
ncbi:MAG: NAD(P)H-binding protein [Hamadaea sp.]|uniref:SDR family oxidoreductase n=1 Tax=Hamadaea sp. TaxID=2024425 RepID=UPI0017D3A674|nr:NmrA family NAD(P)-binding protein [Hamadaea sp.]NUR71384.1 NAD(P)H-binding protein [Hamadaea sp.]NUT22681.1 NAD(P)H-binding protein [Hamadaea sp.]